MRLEIEGSVKPEPEKPIQFRFEQVNDKCIRVIAIDHKAEWDVVAFNIVGDKISLFRYSFVPEEIFNIENNEQIALQE